MRINRDNSKNFRFKSPERVIFFVKIMTSILFVDTLVLLYYNIREYNEEVYT